MNYRQKRCWVYWLHKGSDPFYIGITTDPKGRLYDHRRTFGPQTKMKLLVLGTVDYCADMERRAIAHYRAKVALTNFRPGGEWPGHHWIGLRHSPETIAKMRGSARQRWAKDPEGRKRMAEFQRNRPRRRGYKNSPEQKKIWAELRRQWWAKPENKKKMHEACLGRTQTPETRAKMSEMSKARWKDPEYREKVGLKSCAKARAAKGGERLSRTT